MPNDNKTGWIAAMFFMVSGMALMIRDGYHWMPTLVVVGCLMYLVFDRFGISITIGKNDAAEKNDVR